jgi:hypothetical protein
MAAFEDDRRMQAGAIACGGDMAETVAIAKEQ